MDLSCFDPNGPGLLNNQIFGLPFSEEEARVVLLPVPWEVTVSYHTGTSRGPEHILKASTQVDLLDTDGKEGWRKGFFMRKIDKHILLRNDYLRKEAELYLNFLAEGGNITENEFLKNSLKEINEGSYKLNKWVYEQSRDLLEAGKLVGLVGGDHSTPLGYMKALGEMKGEYGILHIDAHCDLRTCYEGFVYSHASIMHNVLREVPQVTKIVQAGVRDYCEEELDRVRDSDGRVIIVPDQDIKNQLYEGQIWKTVCQNIISLLPQQVYLSFDIDGLDPKLCPHTGTPVMGGFEAEQVFYLLKSLLESGRKLIGFDLVEVNCDSSDEWDANVGARILFRLCNLMVLNA